MRERRLAGVYGFEPPANFFGMITLLASNWYTCAWLVLAAFNYIIKRGPDVSSFVVFKFLKPEKILQISEIILVHDYETI